MLSPVAPCPVTEEKIIVAATMIAKKGLGPELKKHIQTIKALALTDEEPLTLTYRSCVSAENYPEKIFIFEEYKGNKGNAEHLLQKPFKDLMAADILEDVKIEYYTEFQ